MGNIGVIAEYNPLHEGHIRHLTEAKKSGGRVVVVLSGAFVQRGEPAVADPFIRAEWALRCGADLALLLPVIYSLAPADVFAAGGMGILHASGIVDSFSFGSPCGDLSLLKHCAEILSDPPAAFSAHLQNALRNGTGYPAAVENALSGIGEADLAPLMREANDMLGIRYLMENQKSVSPLRPIVVRRPENSVHAEDIRAALDSGDALDGVPDTVRSSLSGYIPYNGFDAALAANLRLAEKEDLKKLPDMNDTLCDTLYAAGRECASAREIADRVSGKNITRSRVKRTLWYPLLGIDRETREEAKHRIPYLRVLGVRNDAVDLLGELAKSASVPVLTGGVLPDDADDFMKRCAELDARAMDLQAMGLPDPKCGAWFTKKLIRI